MSYSSNSSCIRHNDEPATAFCSKHGQKLCMKCLLGAHKDCVHDGDVEYISDPARSHVEKKIPETIRTYEHLATTSKKWSEKYLNSLEKLQQTESMLVTGIKQMQHRIIEQTNKLATDALEIINSVVDDQRSMVKYDIKQMEDFNRKLKEIEPNLERCKAGNDDIVVGEMLSVVNAVQNLHSRFQNTELIDRDVKIHFYVSEELQYLRSKLISFGELCVEDPNCRNTGFRSRPSMVSLSRSLSIESISDDEIDHSVFVLPKTKAGCLKDTSIYCSIHVDQPPTACPAPPPLPDMHPDTPIDNSFAFDTNREMFRTLPRMRIHHHDNDIKQINSLYNEESTTIRRQKPPVPKKRTSVRESTRTDVKEKKNISDNDQLQTYLNHRTMQATTGDTTDEEPQSNTATNQDIGTPEIKVRPPTVIKELTQIFEKKSVEEPAKLTPKFVKFPHSRLKALGKTISGSDNSINSIRDSGIVVDGDKIPPLPKMHRPRFSLSRHIDSLVSNDIDNTCRLSDIECLSDNSEMPSSSPKSSSLTNLAIVEKHNPSMSSDSSIGTFNSASSNASFLSSGSNVDSYISDESFSKDATFERTGHSRMRAVPRLDTQNRKSVSFNLMFSLPSMNNVQKAPHIPHSTINGIAVTSCGMLFICDIENHCLQLFESSGTPVFDYQIKEPFSCSTIREDLVAVTSKARGTLCIFDISESKIACKQEHVLDADVDIFGVGYTKGFFGICCGDRVIIITESLQPYRTVKPIVMVKKKKSRSYFVDVKYIAMEWSRLGFFIYTSEHKSDRVSCVVVGSRDRPVWNCHVGKPESLVLSKESVLVAAKHKIVVLEAASGHRLREIHHEVPTHPVHMVLRDGWLYVSKHSSSNLESRNVRKLPFTTPWDNETA